MTKINKYGLYKTNVPRYKIPGLRSDSRLDDQTQGWWLPMFDKDGNIHMVDTYHIDSGVFSYNDPLKTIIENADAEKDMSWTISKANFDYYYGGSVKVTEQTEKYFVEVCDLRDFEIAKSRTNDYLTKDLVKNVQLWQEHKYPYGCTLLRKGAKKDVTLQVNNLCGYVLDEIRTSYISHCKIEEAIKLAKDNRDQKLIRQVNELKKLVEKVEILNIFQRRYIDDYRASVCDSTQKVKPFILAIAGKAGSGKTTFAKLLYDKLAEKNDTCNIAILPFAEEIKLQAKLVGWDGEKDDKGRKLLQDITKPIKAYHGQDHYAKIVLDKARNQQVDIAIVDDFRFKDEAYFLQEASDEGLCEFITIQVDNPNLVSPLTKDAQKDISENDLNHFEFDYIVDNSGNIDDLKTTVDIFTTDIFEIEKGN